MNCVLLDDLESFFELFGIFEQNSNTFFIKKVCVLFCFNFYWFCGLVKRGLDIELRSLGLNIGFVI